ncbi:16S rRNA (cytidine(1402)-2'-O)-methyltransferase [Candidatus Moduliflexota bacterium]
MDVHSRRGGDGGETRRGRLFIVSTPIGNLEDISLRALRVLKESDLIAAEDTRHTRKLLSHYDIHTPLTSFYQQQQVRRAPAIVEKMLNGASVALVSDAGTPGISDPGWYLVRAAIDAGIEIGAVPGPSAVVTLLSLSGLPTDRFVFEGFLPLKAGKKRRRLDEISGERRTMVFYESPHRLEKTLAVMVEVFGNRPAAVGRELTKLFEEVRRGSLGDLLNSFAGKKVRGEITIAVAGCERKKPGKKRDG